MLKGKYKLIRDNTLEELKNRYEQVLYKNLNKKNFEYYLKLRLKEETIKLLDSKDKIRFKNKIADIFETIDYIMKANKIDKKEIIKTMSLRKKSKGGFDKRYLLISIKE